jgi:hypothetical protein
MAVLLMGVIYKRASDSPFPLPLIIILLAALAIAPVWTPRPQIFSFLLLAVLDYGLDHQNGFLLRRPWILLPLFILWANVHGGFIWGFLLLVAFILGSGIDTVMKRENPIPSRTLALLSTWTLISALGIALNPNGLSLWKLPFYTVGVSIRSITEWSSPDFHQIGLHPILWMVFLLIVGFANTRIPVRWTNTLKVIGFSYMAFISQRSIGPFVIVAAPVIIDSLGPLWEEITITIAGLSSKLAKSEAAKPIPKPVALTINILLLSIFAFTTFERAMFVSSMQEVHNGLPLKAVHWLRENQPEGRMFNAYNWGGYLQWELPEYPVYIDGRADLYGEQLIDNWWKVVNAQKDAMSILETWQVRFVLLEPGWPILEKLAENGWQVLYQDETAVIMRR